MEGDSFLATAITPDRCREIGGCLRVVSFSLTPGVVEWKLKRDAWYYAYQTPLLREM